MNRPAFLLLICSVGLIAPARLAGGHAVLASSDPASGSQVAEAPPRVTLTFTEEPDPALSVIQVLDAGGRDFAASRHRVEADRLTVTVPVEQMPEGVYAINWRVVSRVDGHLTAGVVTFGVGVEPGQGPQPGEEQVPQIDASGVVGRALFLLGLILVIGCSSGALVFFDRTPTIVGRLTLVASLLAAAGLGLMIAAQLSAAGVSLRALYETFIGKALLGRAAALALVTAAALAGLTGRGGRWVYAVVAIGAAAAVVVHTSAGHAAASGKWTAASVSAQSLHFGAVGVWIGGIAVVIAGSRGAGPERALWVRRLSTAAGISLAIVALTGAFRAWVSIGSVRNIVSTPYGRVVAGKAALFGLLAILGAVNRYRNVPRAGTDISGLRRVATIELVIAAAVVAATALLANLSPPVQASGKGAPKAGIVATASDFATTMKIRMEVTPGAPGPNEFRTTITDYDSGEPVIAQNVALRFTYLGVGQVGESTLQLKRERAGVYTASGGNLLLDGPWMVTAVVQRRSTSTEVSIPVATKCNAQITPGGGQPAIYNSQLPGSRSAQGYLDPGRRGGNEIHITFFDENGQELAVDDGLVTLATVRGSEPVRIESRRFSKGHFIGDLELRPGTWRFDFAGSAGDPVRACFEQRISANGESR